MNFTASNFILIVVGVILIFSGPYITYRTVTGMKEKRRLDPSASLQWGSNAINILIAFAFFGAGICFVLNNLRGNPLP